MSTAGNIHSELDLDNNPIPLRLAYNDNDGFPRIVSLWYQYCDGEFLCATHKDSWVVKHIKARPEVGFEIAANKPPYFGIRGTGRVSVYPMGDQPLLDDLLSRYLGNLDSDFAKHLLRRKDSEVVLRISPIKQSSWDYSKRMKSALPA
jgi:hypothetical protein